MLRLVTSNDVPHQTTLRVEGRVVSPWLGVLAEECRRGLSEGRRVIVDLSRVSYIGPAGVTLLRELLGEGIQLANLSPIMAELIGIPNGT